jgi:hypothetical protein
MGKGVGYTGWMGNPGVVVFLYIRSSYAAYEIITTSHAHESVTPLNVRLHGGGRFWRTCILTGMTYYLHMVW